MGAIEKAVTWAIGIANDNSHGYSQQIRWGPSYDCSSLVISAFEQAGVRVKSAGATYTGNMRGVFLRNGFEDVTSSVNLATGTGLQRGDVLLNYANHTAIYIGSGQIVHARSSEGTSDTRDNSGHEIRTQAYWNYPWDCVLRLKEDGETSTPSNPIKREDRKVSVDLTQISKGSQGRAVHSLQILLQGDFYYIGPDGADGDFGANTEAALKKFQSAKDLTADGICGRDTWDKLLNG